MFFEGVGVLYGWHENSVGLADVIGCFVMRIALKADRSSQMQIIDDFSEFPEACLPSFIFLSCTNDMPWC